MVTNVLIQPCASPVAQRNRRKTILRKVRFSDPPYAEALTEPEASSLAEMHPGGASMFWGRTAFHDKAMSEVRTGDVVLFTWKNHIRAIGTVGLNFRNTAFGDLLWHEPGDEEHFPNVFSLLGVADSELPYSVLWEVDGIKDGDPFRQGRVITDLTVVDGILEAVGVSTAEAAAFEQRVTTAAEESLRTNVTMQLEKLLQERTSYQAPARTVEVNRVEAELVQEYVGACPGTAFHRVSSSAGVTDLQTAPGANAELIEAKGGNMRRRVREAVAQLLHYAPANDHPLDVLTALFPARPDATDIRYLHRLGIDCVYRTGSGTFEREAAPDVNREHMRVIWNDELSA